MTKVSSRKAYRVLLLCFSTYMTVYLLRTNFSAAIPLISKQLLLSETELGMVGSVFFVCYATGQLINGFLADHINSFKFIIFALIGTISMNMLMALSDSLWMLTLIWACNGYFQSIFWAVLNRMLSKSFDEGRHSMVASCMSASMVTAFVLSWVFLRYVLRNSSWQNFFLFPAIWAVLILIVWLFCRKGLEDVSQSGGSSGADFKASLLRVRDSKAYIICAVCFCLGFIKESISIWGPTIIAQILNLSLKASSLVLFLIPLINMLGVFFAKFLADRHGKTSISILYPMFSVIILAAPLMLVFKDRLLPLTVIMIIFISAMSYGCNCVLLSMIPLHYAKHDIVSTLIGIFDFSAYIGAALSSLTAGILFSTGRWQLLSGLWLVFAALAIIFVALSKKKTELD